MCRLWLQAKVHERGLGLQPRLYAISACVTQHQLACVLYMCSAPCIHITWYRTRGSIGCVNSKTHWSRLSIANLWPVVEYMLQELYWLPVCIHIKFKAAVLTFRAPTFSGAVPSSSPRTSTLLSQAVFWALFEAHLLLCSFIYVFTKSVIPCQSVCSRPSN